jgi:hypothetical protein
MKRLMVMLVTCAAVWGCAASTYKFNCANGTCEVETSGPARLDLREEFGQTLEIVETADDRVTMKAGAARQTFAMGDTKPLGPLTVSVRNIKGEQAFFSVRR